MVALYNRLSRQSVNAIIYLSLVLTGCCVNFHMTLFNFLFLFFCFVAEYGHGFGAYETWNIYGGKKCGFCTSASFLSATGECPLQVDLLEAYEHLLCNWYWLATCIMCTQWFLFSLKSTTKHALQRVSMRNWQMDIFGVDRVCPNPTTWSWIGSPLIIWL